LGLTLEKTRPRSLAVYSIPKNKQLIHSIGGGKPDKFIPPPLFQVLEKVSRI